MIARAIKNEIRALTGTEHERAEPRASDACAAALFSDEEEPPPARGAAAAGGAPSGGRINSVVESAAQLWGASRGAAGGLAAPPHACGAGAAPADAGAAGEGTLTHATLAGEPHSDANFRGRPDRPAEVSDCGNSLMSLDGDAAASPSGAVAPESDSSMLSQSGSACKGEGDEASDAAAGAAEDGGGGGVLGQKRPACGLLSPPKEEDRKLPMKKLFENLHELAVEAGAGVPGTPPPGFPPPPEGPPPLPALPPGGRARGRPSLAALFAPVHGPSSPRFNRRASAEPPSAVRNGLLAELPPPRAASLDDELHAASAPASKAGSRDASPVRAELAGLAAGSPGGLAGAGSGSRSECGLATGRADSGGAVGAALARPRSRAELPELHEARRRQAATSLLNMEHQCLNGLDMSNIARGCRRAPSKGLPLGAVRPQH